MAEHTPPVTICASPGLLSPALETALTRRGFCVVPLPTAVADQPPSSATVRIALLATPPTTDPLAPCSDLVSAVRATRSNAAAIILVGSPPGVDLEPAPDAVDAWLPLPLSEVTLLPALRSALRMAVLQRDLDVANTQLALRNAETRSLYEVGTALSAEHDIGRLQGLILRRCRELTSADAGSLYITDERIDPQTGVKRGILRFEISQNDSRPTSYERFEIDISEQSIAGYVALSGSVLNLPDVYQLAPDARFQFNQSIDDATGYRTKSMLVVPLRNHDNDIVGVIQLINCKRRFDAILSDSIALDQEVIPFPVESEQVLSAFAGQAASALNNRLLLDSIEQLFEGFVTASVKAIEARDPTTFGHSARVADLTVGIASAVNAIGVGRWRDVLFAETDIRQIRYAGMLHDFGKIGVREHVLLKAKKLSDDQIEVLRLRFALAQKAFEADLSRREIAILLEQGRNAYLGQRGARQAEHRDRIRSLDEDLRQIMRANEPSVLDIDYSADLAPILTRHYSATDKIDRPLLEPVEYQALSIQRGSLTEPERRHIESHVQQTYDFLTLMPWTRQLRDVPFIAWAHHEKLDGTGYPQGLKAEEIPVQSRMMTIADIYDALTATDRPYKPALTYDKALDILLDEAGNGKLDADLLDVFIKRRVYDLTNSSSTGGPPGTRPVGGKG